jgi:hypothetical protein
VIVFFAGWHEDCDDPDDAVHLVGMGLSDAVRLKVNSSGGHDYKWTLEVREPSGWHETSVTGCCSFAFVSVPRSAISRTSFLARGRPPRVGPRGCRSGESPSGLEGNS